MSGPAGYVSAHASTSFAVTVTALQGAGGTTLKLETRARGSAADWTTQDTDSPAVGAVLTATGLTTDAALEWRVIETAGSTTYDGTHGYVTPAVSIWDTLTATIATALEGQGVLAANIYTGLQPTPNDDADEVVAILRTRPERRTDATNATERVVFPVEVEIRHRTLDPTGNLQKAEMNAWQRRLEAALHESYAGDFPGIVGLEDVRVEIASKDDARGNEDEHRESIRARAVVNFAIWRAR